MVNKKLLSTCEIVKLATKRKAVVPPTRAPSLVAPPHPLASDEALHLETDKKITIDKKKLSSDVSNTIKGRSLNKQTP